MKESILEKSEKGKSFRNRRSVKKHEKAGESSGSANEHEVEIHRPGTLQEHISNQGVKRS